MGGWDQGGEVREEGVCKYILVMKTMAMSCSMGSICPFGLSLL